MNNMRFLKCKDDNIKQRTCLTLVETLYTKVQVMATMVHAKPLPEILAYDYQSFY